MNNSWPLCPKATQQWAVTSLSRVNRQKMHSHQPRCKQRMQSALYQMFLKVDRQTSSFGHRCVGTSLQAYATGAGGTEQKAGGLPIGLSAKTLLCYIYPSKGSDEESARKGRCAKTQLGCIGACFSTAPSSSESFGLRSTRSRPSPSQTCQTCWQRHPQPTIAHMPGCTRRAGNQDQPTPKPQAFCATKLTDTLA